MDQGILDRIAAWGFRFSFTHRGERDIASLPFSIRRLRDKARKFAEREIRPRALKLDSKERTQFDWEIARIGAREGWLGMVVPIFFGGNYGPFEMRYGMLSVAVIMEEFCRACSGIGLIFGAHGLGLAPILLSFNWRLWRRYFTPMVESWSTDNPEIAAFAITEPGAGSDAEDPVGGAKAKLVSFASRALGGWRLNGRKCFISNGSVASLFTVFASVEKREGVKAWTCFMVKRGQRGFSIGRVEDKLGQRASPAAELVFDDVFVSDEDVVWPEKTGWDLNTFTLDASRGPVGAIALGIAQGAYDRAFDYCLETRRNGAPSFRRSEGPLIEQGWIRQALGEMAAKLEAARSLVYRACSVFPPSGKLSAMAKSLSSDVGMEVCARCVEILGPEGLERDNIVEKHYRDAKLCQIYEGTNQINRLRIMEVLEEEHKTPLAKRWWSGLF